MLQTLPKPADFPSMPQFQPNLLPEVQEGLNIANRIIPQSITSLSLTLNRQLAGYQKLPYFYYRDAARSLGLNPDICKQTRVHLHPWAIDKDLQTACLVMSILLQIHSRLSPYPLTETYAEACARRAERVKALIAMGISKNRLAKYIRCHHRSIDNITAGSLTIENCPWRTLALLANTQELLDQTDYKRPIENTWEHYLHPQNAEPMAAPSYLNPAWKPTPPMGPCGHCGASSAALIKEDDPYLEVDLRTCRICSRVSYIDETDATPEEAAEETIDQYGECHECKAPWQHLKMLPHPDRYGNKVYECKRCLSLNRVNPDPEALTAPALSRKGVR